MRQYCLWPYKGVAYRSGVLNLISKEVDHIYLKNIEPFFYTYAVLSRRNKKYCSRECRLVNETCAIVLLKAGMQTNQFASTIDLAGDITNFTENHVGKSFSRVFSQNSKQTCSLMFLSVIRRCISGKHPIHENNTIVCFH